MSGVRLDPTEAVLETASGTKDAKPSTVRKSSVQDRAISRAVTRERSAQTELKPRVGAARKKASSASTKTKPKQDTETLSTRVEIKNGSLWYSKLLDEFVVVCGERGPDWDRMVVLRPRKDKTSTHQGEYLMKKKVFLQRFKVTQ